MSFGDGNLHERAEQLERDLAGWRALTDVQSGRIGELERENEELREKLRERTCEITDNGSWSYPYVCSSCGASFDADVNNGDFNYCPNCGRKVVSA